MASEPGLNQNQVCLRSAKPSSASEPKKGMMPFILVQHTLYAVLYRTANRYSSRMLFQN